MEKVISDNKKEEIKNQAKRILDNFASSLDKVKVKPIIQNKEFGGFREESQGNKRDEDFRDRMFKNAPKKNENAILAEKKNW